MAMDTVKTICSDLGRPEIIEHLSVTPQQVSNAVRDEYFPSNWYIGISELCLKKGIKVPDHLFTKMKKTGTAA